MKIQISYPLVGFLMLLICNAGRAQDQWKNVYSSPAWAERDVWQKADSLIRLLAIDSASQVADLGCHEGYMTMKLASRVGVKGKVFAVDINPARLDLLRNRIQAAQLNQVTAVLGRTDDPQFPSRKLDGVIILDSYHEMKWHNQILQKVRISLRPGGRLLLCEPIAEFRRTWSREEQEKVHELGIDFAIKDLKRAGFKVIFKQDRFIDREKIKGDKMWVIVAQK